MGLKLQGSRLRGLRILSRLGGRQETDGGIVYKQIRINAKLQIGKRGQKTELTGRSPLRRRRSALDSSPIEEEEDIVLQNFFRCTAFYQVLGDILSLC